MILTTGPTVEGRPIARYLDVVSAQAIMRVHQHRRRPLGHVREGVRERRPRGEGQLRGEAETLGADAVVAVALDYEEVGDEMLMVAASGTAVKLAG